MKLSRSFEQACGVLAIIAEHKGHPVTNSDLNKRLGVSPSYLMKITRRLVVAEIIMSTHGVGGGYVLSRNPSEIRLSDVVRATETDEVFFAETGIMSRVFPGSALAQQGISVVGEALERAEAVWWRELANTTMQDVIDDASKEVSDV